jgi:hypothetical protein
MSPSMWIKAASASSGPKRAIRHGLVVALSLGAISTAAAQAVNVAPARGLRTPAPHVDLTAPAQKVGAPTGPTAVDSRPRVPDVVGLEVDTAGRRLLEAGYAYDLQFLPQPDPSIPYGFVKAMIPPAGSILQPGGRLVIQIPRSASKVGSAVLSIADLARQAGFDLDNGRFEDIGHGADLVLSKHDHVPIVDAGGKTRYDNFTVYADPTGGAVFRQLRDYPSAAEIGSYTYFAKCRAAFADTRDPPVTSTAMWDGPMVLCVRTVENSIAIAAFSGEQQPRSDSNVDYKFAYAIFPPSILPRPRAPERGSIGPVRKR